MKKCILALALLLILSPTLSLAQDQLLTTAEATNYKSTSTNEDVLNFCRKLAASSHKIHFSIIGTTAGNNAIPLLTVGDPAPTNPAEMKNDPRLVIYIQANIHSGEVEGKEAVQMLARDLAGGKYPEIMESCVLLICPNYNSDGNSHIDENNRYYQPGPDTGVGVRPNDLNLDLNRDWIKMEAPETQAICKHVLNPWDPALLIDCHTTDGSLHMEPMTWSPQINPSGDQALLDYAWNVLMKNASKTLKDEFGYESIPYGNWKDRKDLTKGWGTFGPEPRYTTNYYGMRNRLSVLLETYAFAKFDIRVKSTYGIIVGILKQLVADKSDVIKMIKDADKRAYQRLNGLDPQKDKLFVAWDVMPFDWKIKIKTWEGAEYGRDEKGHRTIKPKGKRLDLEIPYFGKMKGTDAVALPAYYVVPKAEKLVVKKLLLHNVAVLELEADIKTKVDKYHITEIKNAPRPYQGHLATTIKGEWKEEEVTLDKGCYLVSTAQPNGMLAAQLLAPESTDSLTTWNFFDRKLAPQWGRGFYPHPVVKIKEFGSFPVRLIK